MLITNWYPLKGKAEVSLRQEIKVVSGEKPFGLELKSLLVM